MSKEPSKPSPSKPINYAAAAAAGGQVRAAPQPSRPAPNFQQGNSPQQQQQSGNGPTTGKPPPRTTSAPPEQQGMQQHLKNQPAFIPDKSAGQVRAAPFVPGNRFQVPVFQPGMATQSFVPRSYPPGGMPPYAGGYQGFQPPPQQQFGSPVAAPQSGSPVAANGTPPAKKKTAAIQIMDPKTGKPVQFKPAALKFTAASFEPTKKVAEEPKKEAVVDVAEKPEKKEETAAVAPKATNSAHGEVTRPGRWKPPADDATTSTTTATSTASPTPAATAVAAAPKEAEVKKAEAKPAANDAVQEPKKVTPTPTPAAEAAPVKKESDVVASLRRKKEAAAIEDAAKKKADEESAAVAAAAATADAKEKEKSEETPVVADATAANTAKVEAEPKKEELPLKGKEEATTAASGAGEAGEWDLAADKLMDIDQRVAASAKEVEAEMKEEKKEPPVPEPIRYDGLSFNPLEDSDDKKKKYSKEFLIQFRPYFTSKPADLEDLDIVDSGGGDSRPSHDSRSPNNRGGGGRRDRNQSATSRAAEQWDKSRGEGGSSRDRDRDRYGGNGGGGSRGYGGGGGGRGNKKQPVYTGPPVEPLKRSETGWKAEKIDTSTEDGLRLQLIKEAQGHLNKMTQVTYEKLSTRLTQIADREGGDPPLPGLLRELINKVFEQALLQPTFCAMYAALCARISRSVKMFRPNLLNKCQEEFEADSIEPPADLSGPEKDILRFKAKKRMLGNIKFICELYKQKMLIEDIMHFCIQRLFKMDLQNVDEEQTEALCDFLIRIGKLLDAGEKNDKDKQKHIPIYFEKLEVMRSGPNIPPRLRFMVEDVIDFRVNGWRVAKAGPKLATRGPRGGGGSDKGSRGSGSQDVRQSQGSGRGGGGANTSPAGKGDGWKEVKTSKTSGSKSGKTPKGDKDKKKGGRITDPRGSPSDRSSGGDRNSGRKGGASDSQSPSAAAPASNASATGSSSEVTAEDEAKYAPAVGNALDEYYDTQDIEGVTYALEKDFPERYRAHFVCDAFKYALTSSEKDRAQMLDCLFAPEVTELLSTTVLRNGVGLIVKNLADIALDHPAAPRKFAPLLARAVNEDLYSFKDMLSLLNIHVDEGRGFGVVGDALGGALQELVSSSSEEKIAELIAANSDFNMISKLPEKSRNEAKYAEFLQEFSLQKVLPSFASAGGAAVAVQVRKGSAVSDGARSRGGSFEVPREAEYKVPELDELGQVVLKALRDNGDVKAAMIAHLKPKDGDLFGDFDACASANRALLEYWIVCMPEAGIAKQLSSEGLKKEAKWFRATGPIVVQPFCGSDASEVGESVLKAFAEFSQFHGKEINPTFYLRTMQYYEAYHFLSLPLLQQYSKANTHPLSNAIARVLVMKEELKK